MNVDVLDSNLESNSSYDERAKGPDSAVPIDARRRVEDKIEEIRLRKEMQEYDFDF